MAFVKEKFTFTVESEFEEIDDELWLQVKEDPNKFAELAKRTFDEVLKDYATITSFHAQYIEGTEIKKDIEEKDEESVNDENPEVK